MAASLNSTGRCSTSLNASDFTEAQKMEALNHLDYRMTMTVLPVTIFVAIEAVVAFYGNIVVLYVFLFHYKNCNFRLFVLCLGVTELISTLTSMPGEVVTQLYWYTYPDPILCKIKTFSNLFTLSAEAMALLAITTDRYLKACQPLGRQISVKAARLIVLAIFTIAVLVSIPTPFFWGTHRADIVSMCVPVAVTICGTDQAFVGRSEPVTYSFTMQGILCTLLAVMLILCILIARRLLCQKTELFSRSNLHPAPKIDAIHVSTVAAGEPPSNLNSIEIVEECHASGASPSDGISDAKPNSQGRSETSDDRLRTSDAECIEVERKVGRQHEPWHARRNPHIAQKIKRMRSKTIIMFLLTVTFSVTAVVYLTLLTYITKGILAELSDAERATYFFFFRLYFINRVINPIIYGVLDPQFKHVISQYRCFRTEQRNSNC